MPKGAVAIISTEPGSSNTKSTMGLSAPARSLPDAPKAEPELKKKKTGMSKDLRS